MTKKRERKTISRFLSFSLARKRQSFIWDEHHCAPRATYPTTESEDQQTSSLSQRRSAEPMSYLVLHCAGFTMPVESLQRRCAFTAPFHPFHQQAEGGLLSVALSVDSGFTSFIALMLSSALLCSDRTFLITANRNATARFPHSRIQLLFCHSIPSDRTSIFYITSSSTRSSSGYSMRPQIWHVKNACLLLRISTCF